ncbi:MAG: hypothetical protein EPN30_04260 [Actinomycetota bacterium]|nr:MAG: hypothetical protein EPN30_04260 [Actinomycetota bacterium]
MGLSRYEISQILRTFEESHFADLHIKSGDTVLDLKKTSTHNATPPSGESERSTQSLELLQSTTPHPLEPQEQPTRYITVAAPALGVFRRSSPFDELPLVEAGDEVSVNDTLAFLDLLGTLTPVTPGQPGRVAEICAEADQLVEYQQELFKIQVLELP